MSVLNGIICGISGWPRWLRVWSVQLAFGAFIAVVNIGSILIENPVSRRRFETWEPVVWEMSSFLTFSVLILPLLWVYDRYRPEKVGMPAFAGIQSLAFLGMTLGHVGGMVAWRKLAYWAIENRGYDFSRGDLLLRLIYEGRKDAISYIIFLTIFWLDARLSDPPASPAIDQRIELREGSKTFYVQPEDVLLVEAAGNYVEVHTPARKHLIRDTLSAFARKLDDRFVQIHRSRIVNRLRISSLEPTPSGDVKIRLDDGRELTGSRRYKAALKL